MLRYLSKSKMFINDETWSFIGDVSIQYLSEKTLIFLITAYHHTDSSLSIGLSTNIYGV